MRIYSFIGKQGVYLVMASTSEQARAMLMHDIGADASGLIEGDCGVSLGVTHMEDFGYVIARPDEMLSPGSLV